MRPSARVRPNESGGGAADDEEIRNVSEAITTGEPDLHPPRL